MNQGKSFTYWNQILCMIFEQLIARNSMRDLMLSFKAHKKKRYHLGPGSTVTVPIWRKQTGKGIIVSTKNCLIA